MPGCEICCAPSGLLIEVRQVLLEELPGDLGHDAGAIPGVCISRAGPAMLHAPQGCQGLQPACSNVIHKKMSVCTNTIRHAHVSTMSRSTVLSHVSRSRAMHTGVHSICWCHHARIAA